MKTIVVPLLILNLLATLALGGLFAWAVAEPEYWFPSAYEVQNDVRVLDRRLDEVVGGGPGSLVDVVASHSALLTKYDRVIGGTDSIEVWVNVSNLCDAMRLELNVDPRCSDGLADEE